MNKRISFTVEGKRKISDTVHLIVFDLEYRLPQLPCHHAYIKTRDITEIDLPERIAIVAIEDGPRKRTPKEQDEYRKNKSIYQYRGEADFTTDKEINIVLVRTAFDSMSKLWSDFKERNEIPEKYPYP